MKEIVILGAGGFAREVAFLLEEINRASPTYTLLGFVEADASRAGARVGKHRVLCGEDDLETMRVAAAIGVGSPSLIRKIATRLGTREGLEFPNLVHPGTIWDAERVEMGRGNVVCAGNVFTTDIRIGSFNVFNLSSTYGHDVVIGDGSVFNPGVNVSGGVTVEDGCLLGTGAKVLQSLRIGREATVGAGAVVTADVPAATTVVGVPARPRPPREERP